LGYAAIAFGVWYIFYYIFLKILCGWPHSLWDWDILFLLPLPWWGPVLAPVSIALLMILWGTLVSGRRFPPARNSSEWKIWLLNFIGVALALYLFMADSIHVAGQGVEVLRDLLPASFNWPLFGIALLLMAAPVRVEIEQLSQRCELSARRGGANSNLPTMVGRVCPQRAETTIAPCSGALRTGAPYGAAMGYWRAPQQA